MLVLYLSGSCPKTHSTPALVRKEGVWCINLHNGSSYAIKWVTSSSPNVVCTATARLESAQPSALWHQAVLLAVVSCFRSS